ncbi:polysaccharide biosynthesis/export family protein [Sphingomonas sp. HT-1]|uniref:polysaccharide biosynthesis/export family protein n=1 Tax=unclassified Sphingomonas TaxID=196159 RepID=UPI0009E8C7B5|nr:MULTISPECIES: polysaccharide biosynthesis/export family protein [unclassified Sphingomonas]
MPTWVVLPPAMPETLPWLGVPSFRLSCCLLADKGSLAMPKRPCCSPKLGSAQFWRKLLFTQSFRKSRAWVLMAGAASLSACATLPTNGPTAGQVTRVVGSPQDQIGMRLQDITLPLITTMVDESRQADEKIITLAQFAEGAGAATNDVVGPGDVLSIKLFEVGVSMFGAMVANGEAPMPAARAQDFDTVLVDRNGTIKLPYVGTLMVAGRTPTEIGKMVEQGYARRSQAPQALVMLKRNLSNTVYVTGDVRKPGRIELTLRGERLSAAIAEAGGTASNAQDILVRFSRRGRVIEERLDRIRVGAADDIRLQADDVIELIKEPQTYTVFGAATKVTQVPFDQTELSLAEAIARAGGPNDALANPKAIFLFRYVRPIDGSEAKPTIYRLDLMQPQSYFLAQKFMMRKGDVLYISNAKINRISKFVGILNQLFSPFITARALSQ